MSERHPIEILQREHEEALAQLQLLEQSARHLHDHGFSTEALAQVMESTRFINTDIRSHNEKEERALFPILDAYLPPNGPTAVMRAEHQQLWDQLDRLEKLTHSLQAHSQNLRLREELAETAFAVVHLLSNHIWKENNILFPMAQGLLRQDEWKDVIAKMA